MTIDEMKSKISEIEKEANLKIKKIYADYAFSNNPYKIGDIIEDHICRIQIDNIKFAVLHGSASCVYYGTLMQKNGKPFKNNKRGVIYQTNIKCGDAI